MIRKININYFPKHDKQAGLSNEEFCILWGRNCPFVTLRKANIRFAPSSEFYEAWNFSIDSGQHIDPFFKGQAVREESFSETSIRDKHYTLRKIPKQYRSHWLRGRSLTSYPLLATHLPAYLLVCLFICEAWGPVERSFEKKYLLCCFFFQICVEYSRLVKMNTQVSL